MEAETPRRGRRGSDGGDVWRKQAWTADCRSDAAGQAGGLAADWLGCVQTTTATREAQRRPWCGAVRGSIETRRRGRVIGCRLCDRPKAPAEVLPSTLEIGLRLHQACRRYCSPAQSPP